MKQNVVIVVLATLTSNHAYDLSYYDYTNTTKITTYKIDNLCQTETERQLQTATYTILQKKNTQYMRGYSCQIIRSNFLDYCGVYSHTKMAQIPTIEIAQPITKYECLNMAISEQFTMPDNTKHKIELNAENIISVTDLGTINIGDDSVSCKGQSKRIGNHVVNDIISVSQYKVIVTEERFRAKGNNVEALKDHLLFPTHCSTDTH